MFVALYLFAAFAPDAIGAAEPGQDPKVMLEACLNDPPFSSTEGRCLGLVSSPCAEKADRVYETALAAGATREELNRYASAHTDCSIVESDAWDEIVGNQYAAIVSALEGHEAGQTNPADANVLDEFQSAHSAWLAFREAECSFRSTTPSGWREFAFASCLVELNGKRAIAYRNFRLIYGI